MSFWDASKIGLVPLAKVYCVCVVNLSYLELCWILSALLDTRKTFLFCLARVDCTAIMGQFFIFALYWGFNRKVFTGEQYGTPWGTELSKA